MFIKNDMGIKVRELIELSMKMVTNYENIGRYNETILTGTGIEYTVQIGQFSLVIYIGKDGIQLPTYNLNIGKDIFNNLIMEKGLRINRNVDKLHLLNLEVDNKVQLSIDKELEYIFSTDDDPFSIELLLDEDLVALYNLYNTIKDIPYRYNICFNPVDIDILLGILRERYK